MTDEVFVKDFDLSIHPVNRIDQEKIFITSFGEFVISFKGREPIWRTRKVKELISFLFYKQRSLVTKEIIVDVLWPDYDEIKANQLFYTTMSYLRKNLREIGIKGLVLCKNKQYFLDTSMFQSDYQQLLEIKTALDHKQWEKLRALPAIRELYQGSFLEFCMEEWCYGKRSYMERICIQCCEAQGVYEMSQKNYLAAEDCFSFIREIDPFYEDAIVMLLECHSKKHDFLGLKNLYSEVKIMYKEELGIHVGKRIDLIYSQCMTGLV